MIATPAVESKPMHMVPLQEHHKLNAQNHHIAASFDRANWVLIELMLMGITVERLVIEGATPEITIQDSPLCDRLGGHVFTTTTPCGRERCTRRAFLEGCLVQWESRPAP